MILDARPIVEKKIEELKNRVSWMIPHPSIVIVRVGNDGASEKYVNNKVKMCKEVDIYSTIQHYDENISQSELEQVLINLSNNATVHGILLQLPLPKHLDESRLTECIIPSKDIDGFTAENMGKLILGQDGNVACTPKGIIELLKQYNIPMQGKDVLIINRSNIVGKPLAHLMLKENATVTIAHSHTHDLYERVKRADIVITGIGQANAFRYYHFKEGATVIDVSINFDENGKMCGDVCKGDYPQLLERNCNYSPVPNGVGRMTVLSLIEQVVDNAEDKFYLAL